MTDDPHDQRFEPEPDAASPDDGFGDEPIESLLDRASSLASEMSAEVGESAADGRGSPSHWAGQAEEKLADLNDLAKSLDRELEQMDALSKRVGAEVGDESERDDEPGDGGAEEGLRPVDGSALTEAAAALDEELSQRIGSAGGDAGGSDGGGAAQAEACGSGAGEDGAGGRASVDQEHIAQAEACGSGGDESKPGVPEDGPSQRAQGPAPPAPSTTETPPVDTGIAAGAESEVPDFMLDFLQPDEPKPPKQDPAPASGLMVEVNPNDPLVSTAADTPATGDDLAADLVRADPSPGRSAAGLGPNTAARDGNDEPAASVGRASVPAADGGQGRARFGAVRSLAPLAARKAVEGAAGMLEVIDRPFGWVPDRAKSLIGIAALATFATSVIVLVVSIL